WLPTCFPCGLSWQRGAIRSSSLMIWKRRFRTSLRGSGAFFDLSLRGSMGTTLRAVCGRMRHPLARRPNAGAKPGRCRACVEGRPRRPLSVTASCVVRGHCQQENQLYLISGSPDLSPGPTAYDVGNTPRRKRTKTTDYQEV